MKRTLYDIHHAAYLQVVTMETKSLYCQIA